MNGHGGKREGAGRKPRPAAPVSCDDPQDFLQAVMQGKVVPSVAQLDAAKTLAKIAAAGKGKKEQAAGRAKAAASGKFATKSPPKLAVVGR